MINKKNLAEIISTEENISKAQASRIIDIIVNGITDTVARGEKVTLTGFGIFEAQERAARIGVNPATGEKLNIPASKNVKFKAGKAFKEAVNK